MRSYAKGERVLVLAGSGCFCYYISEEDREGVVTADIVDSPANPHVEVPVLLDGDTTMHFFFASRLVSLEVKE